jgi:glycosyltransferase involved in cell wall biosynthesis
MSMSFVVVIPAYNHGQTVAAVVRDARCLGFPIIVVDDGSDDGYDWPALKTPGVHILHHRYNRGKGAALVTGFRAAATAGARWAITLDADGQHHPGDAVALMKAIAKPDRPIVVGCRQGMLDAGAPWTSRFGRGFSNFWIRLSGGPSTHDTQSGFRIYPLPETLALPVRAGRYQYELEVLVKAARQGVRVIEAPIGVTYQPPQRRISHFRPFVDFLRNTGTFSRLIFQRMIHSGLAVVRRRCGATNKRGTPGLPKQD